MFNVYDKTFIERSIRFSSIVYKFEGENQQNLMKHKQIWEESELKNLIWLYTQVFTALNQIVDKHDKSWELLCRLTFS